MQHQTYENLQIIVSDNHSDTDPFPRLPEDVRQDARIKLSRQNKNIGAYRNFEFVFRQASGRYFMWASDDDLWDSGFIKAAVDFLESNPGFDAWFSSIDNISPAGEVIRHYPSFERFTSSGSRYRDVARYLFEPEIQGKANLMYAVYRRETIQFLVDHHMMTDFWGSDMCLNLALISRYRVKCVPEVLLHKRLPDGNCYGDRLQDRVIRKPWRHLFPIREIGPYFLGNFRAAHGLAAKALVVASFLLRAPVAALNLLRDRPRKASRASL